MSTHPYRPNILWTPSSPAHPGRRVERTLDRQGFALPAVLLIMVLLGAVAMAASMMANQQVRSAGDLRSSVMAVHAAEGGAAWISNNLTSGSLDWMDGDSLFGEDLLAVGADLPYERPEEANHGDAAWWVDYMRFDGDEVVFLVRGEVVQTGTQRAIEVVYERGTGGSTSPFASAVVGCESVHLSGSGRIDSWNSQLGPYSAGLAQTNANVGTLNGQGDVVLSGHAPIWGDVLSARDIRVSGSSWVQGDYIAVRNIQYSGNPSCPSAQVRAGGLIASPGTWWMNGCGNPEFDDGADIDYTPQPCDPLDIENMMADSMDAYRPPPGDFQGWPHGGWRPNPIEIATNQGFNGVSIGPGAHPITFDAGAADFMFVDGNFSLSSSGHLRIRNPSVSGDPQQFHLFVDGNLSWSGGSQLEIDPGVSLTIFTTGRVNISGGHSQLISPTVNLNPGGAPEFAPTMGIYSSFSGSNGVSISGNAPISAVVYAPLTAVSVSGSGRLYGAVLGNTISVSGAGGVHYDETLGLLGGAPTGGGGNARISSWRQITD